MRGALGGARVFCSQSWEQRHPRHSDCLVGFADANELVGAGARLAPSGLSCELLARALDEASRARPRATRFSFAHLRRSRVDSSRGETFTSLAGTALSFADSVPDSGSVSGI